MKIKIDYEDLKNNNYIKILFRELEKDKDLERIVKGIRKKHNIIPNIKRLLLRSWISLVSEEDVDKVVKAFPFLQDWRKGIKSLIVGGVFILSPDSYHIKLRVRNNKNPYQRTVTEMPNEEGVKIVLTSRISKKELKDWIENNWYSIVYYLRTLPSFSKKPSIRENFERDRLLVYLKRNRNMPYKEIADILNDGSNEKTLEKAYKDFPY